jgi:hypothetical protein
VDSGGSTQMVAAFDKWANFLFLSNDFAPAKLQQTLKKASMKRLLTEILFLGYRDGSKVLDMVGTNPLNGNAISFSAVLSLVLNHGEQGRS